MIPSITASVSLAIADNGNTIDLFHARRIFSARLPRFWCAMMRCGATSLISLVWLRRVGRLASARPANGANWAAAAWLTTAPYKLRFANEMLWKN